ncbi:hypothetical protein MMC09_001383 [Bachmanniomyces sp. S44760]|nr:hypothetical protein [Bachmanniomyces sp. S44760]
MSEYWKSTPKYWCKHCKTYVRDTKLEKQNHEATPKHQGNLKRFLRDLHHGHEREEREKQRAKDEVDRLNGVKSGPSAASGPLGHSEGAPWRRKAAAAAVTPASSQRQLTPAEKKAHMAQLADMGISVPEDYRREVAMAGDWQTMSETPIYETLKKEEGDEGNVKSSGLNVGVRKRKPEDEEDEAGLDDGRPARRKGWGTTARNYPGRAGDDDDLDALLDATKASKQSTRLDTEVPGQGIQPLEASMGGNSSIISSPGPQILKGEPSMEVDSIQTPLSDTIEIKPSVKKEDDLMPLGVVFKKRKPKATRT